MSEKRPTEISLARVSRPLTAAEFHQLEHFRRAHRHAIPLLPLLPSGPFAQQVRVHAVPQHHAGLRYARLQADLGQPSFAGRIITATAVPQHADGFKSQRV
jgi:hypothetical protein